MTGNKNPDPPDPLVITLPLDRDLMDRVRKLSPREREVFVGLALGESNRDIAKHYGISTKTVDTHRGHLLRKLGARNNADATRIALRTGVVDFDTKWTSQVDSAGLTG